MPQTCGNLGAALRTLRARWHGWTLTDIGCTYLVSGIGLAWRAWRAPAAGWVALPEAHSYLG
jgi:hypothetical protein